MKYIILEGESPNFLSRYVNEHIQKNWLCQGGIGIRATSIGTVVYYQAMIHKFVVI